MRIKVQFKDPDWDVNLPNDIALALPSELTQDEKEAVVERRLERIKKALYRWIDLEYVQIAFDTDAGKGVKG